MSACDFGEDAAQKREVCDQTYPALTGRVVDLANVIPPESEARLVKQLAEFETRTQHQLVVATTASLQGKPIEKYSLCLANHWGIGRKDINDGVMILVSPAERVARIEVGYGLEAALTDEEAKVIMDTKMVPAFLQSDFGAGISASAEAIISEIS